MERGRPVGRPFFPFGDSFAFQQSKAFGDPTVQSFFGKVDKDCLGDYSKRKHSEIKDG